MGETASGPVLPTSMKCASPLARATSAVPTLPPAPARFSTTMGWPSRRPIGSASRRPQLIDDAGGGERHHQADRPLRRPLRPGQAGQRQQAQRAASDHAGSRVKVSVVSRTMMPPRAPGVMSP